MKNINLKLTPEQGRLLTESISVHCMLLGTPERERKKVKRIRARIEKLLESKAPGE